MKPNQFNSITSCLAAALVTPAIAIEGPADDARAPAAAQVDIRVEAAPEAKQQAPFLGVVTMGLEPALSDHLNLQPGKGIIIRALQPDGPAEKAGLAVNDIITSVGGQEVDSSLDLTQQIRKHAPGDAIQLDIIHKGKPAAIDVTLGVRPAALQMMGNQPLDQLKLNGLPEELADRVRDAIQGNLKDLDIKIEDAQIEIGPQLDEAMLQMKRRIEEAMEGLNEPPRAQGNKIDIMQNATFRFIDEQGSIELKSDNGNSEVTVRDKDNKLTWTGPWETDQDKAAAPDDVRKRVERFDINTKVKGNGIQLQLNAPANPDDE